MEKELKEILPFCSRPIRYTNGEYNLPVKERRSDSLLFCLIFPDIYEIGMSNYGLKILYHILNSDPRVCCERAFAPWPDFGQLLKAKGLPLYSLETKTPLNRFHILGFSLQSELSYTTVPYILDLAGIPLKSEERKNRHPLIIAGGPCCVNPLPVNDFFDAFVIGDGEEVVREIVEVYRDWDGKNRDSLLSALTKIEGIYVPLLDFNKNGGRRIIKKRTINYLAEADFPFPPIVPICEIVHDRLTIEVMRGCTQGCRFCQAGIVNRPLRIRRPEEILRLAERGIRNSGWEELSLLAFSVSDYPNLPQLLSQLNALLYMRRVAISLPSMRGEDFSLDLARELVAIKKTGLTFAPETTAPRLKALLNKEVKEETILQTLAVAADAGWLGVKLYFMIGLPQETERDIREISSFVTSCARQLKRMRIKFSLSPFIPKPHTPLQWQPFSDLAEITSKLELLKSETKRKNITRKWENPYQSQIQAILARGDEKLGRVISRVYEKGERLSEWSEFFNYNLWQESFAEECVDFNDYLRERSLDERLPWDFIDVGVKKAFLREEAKRAERFLFTANCQQAGCYECGACLKPAATPLKLADTVAGEEESFVEIPTEYKRKPQILIATKGGKKITYRIKYTVGEGFCFASHLDIVRTIYRALRRSELPVAFSCGFSPHPLVSFGPPLPVGVTSRGEYLDIQLAGSYSGNLIRDLAPFLPKDIRILENRVIRRKTPSLGKAINLAQYGIKPDNLLAATQDELNRRWKELPGIYRADFNPEEFDIFVAVAPGIRLFTLLSQLLGLKEERLKLLPIERKESYILRDNKMFSPLEDL